MRTIRKKRGFKLAPKSPNLGFRWKRALHWLHFATTTTNTAGTVYLTLFEFESTATVDAVQYIHGAALAGNVIVGIYGPIPTEETCLGAPVVVQSASTAVSGSANQPSIVTFTPTRIGPGRYYAAVEFDDGANTFMRHSNQTQVTGWTQTYARGGGYGALTDPCPAVTDASTSIPGVYVRFQP